jgi:hypothetical protein
MSFKTSLPSPILPNAIFVEIYPRGEEYVMTISRSRGVGNIVARGASLAPAITEPELGVFNSLW